MLKVKYKDEDHAEKLKESVSLVDFLQQRGFDCELTSGGEYRYNCMFHDDANPSLSVNDDMGVYNCFSCSAKGDIYTFLQEHDKLSFRDAVKVVEAFVGGKPLNTKIPYKGSYHIQLNAVERDITLHMNKYKRILGFKTLDAFWNTYDKLMDKIDSHVWELVKEKGLERRKDLARHITESEDQQLLYLIDLYHRHLLKLIGELK